MMKSRNSVPAEPPKDRPSDPSAIKTTDINELRMMIKLLKEKTEPPQDSLDWLKEFHTLAKGSATMCASRH